MFLLHSQSMKFFREYFPFSFRPPLPFDCCKLCPIAPFMKFLLGANLRSASPAFQEPLFWPGFHIILSAFQEPEMITSYSILNPKSILSNPKSKICIASLSKTTLLTWFPYHLASLSRTWNDRNLKLLTKK